MGQASRWVAAAVAAVVAAVLIGGGALLGASLRTTVSSDGPWRRGGTAVSTDVITVIRGPRHCDWQSSQWLMVGWPLGTPRAGIDGVRMYVRDPLGVLADAGGPADPFQADVDLPPDARWSGYRTEHYELWLAPSDADRAVYLVRGEAVERWPRSPEVMACG